MNSANIKDVAKHAGVSISTVSHVINSSKYVSKELKLKVQQAIKELEFEVDPLARGLKNKKTRSIGVIVTNINCIFFPPVLSSIQETALKKGYSLTFCNSSDDFENEKRFVSMLKSSWMDGIIIDSVAAMDQLNYFKKLANINNKHKYIPVVSIERKVKDLLDAVYVDNKDGGFQCVSHLIQKGCKKIVHITGPVNSSMVDERKKGYIEALRLHNLEKYQIIKKGNFSPLSGYNAIKELFQSGEKFDGVFASNDQMAVGAIKALKERGLRIPEDIKVVGFDNSFVGSMINPSLTTMNVPKLKMGTAAAELLIKKIEQPSLMRESIELPINLIVRQSTDLNAKNGDWDLLGW